MASLQRASRSCSCSVACSPSSTGVCCISSSRFQLLNLLSCVCKDCNLRYFYIFQRSRPNRSGVWGINISLRESFSPTVTEACAANCRSQDPTQRSPRFANLALLAVDNSLSLRRCDDALRSCRLCRLSGEFCCSSGLVAVTERRLLCHLYLRSELKARR